ncbi:hypothetical protein GCM10027062_28150 [Nocardioides hungaricus]
MPTTRPRYPITETQEVAEALEVAASRWPEDRDKPRILLLHLIAEGMEAVRASDAARIAERRAAVERTAGSASDIFEPGYLERLREDWPE